MTRLWHVTVKRKWLIFHHRIQPFFPASQHALIVTLLFFTTLSESESCSVVSDSLRPHGLYSPWNSPGQNTGVGSLSLLQGIFPIQESNQGLLHCRRILYQPSYQGSPSFRIDWFYLFAVQGTLKSLLQHHILKASILWHLAFFMVQLSHLYMTFPKVWKNHSFDYMVIWQKS